MSALPRRRWLASLCLASVAVASGCGTQLSRDEIIATSGNNGSAGLVTDPLAVAGGQTSGGSSGAGAPGAVTGPGVSTGTAAAATGSTGSGTGAAGTATGGSGTGTGAATTGASGGTGAGAASTGAAGPGTGGAPVPAGPASGEPINIGQVGTFSGVGGGVVGSGKPALAAWVSYTNARGGINGRPIKLFQADDGGDAAKSSALMQGMVETNKVVAFVGVLTPISFTATFNFAATKKFPVIGGDVSADGWYKTPFVFPQGSYIDSVFYANLRQAVMEGKKKLGIVACVESGACVYTAKAYGENGAAKAAGAQIVYTAQASVASLSYQSVCQSAKDAGADVLAISLDGAGLSRFARDCAQIGYKPQYITAATAVNDSQASDPNLDGTIIASNVFPWTATAGPGPSAFQEALKRYAPTATVGAAAAQAWAAAELFKAAASKVPSGTPITSASVVKAVQSLGTFTNGGLSPAITYGPGLPSKGRCAFIMRLTNKKWTPVTPTPSVCQP